MPKNKQQSRRSRAPATIQGTSAISRIIRFSKDQAVERIGRRYSGPNSMNKISSDIKMLKSLINTELKHIDSSVANFTVNLSTPVVQTLITVAQGSASTQRTGDSVKFNRIDINFQYTFDSGTVATTAAQNQVFNWYLVRYLKTPSSGSVNFAITDFLLTDANGFNSPMSQPNTDLNEDFQVMASGQVHLDLHFNTTSISRVTKMVEISHTCSFHQTFSGASAATNVDNSVHLVFTAISGGNGGGQSNCAYFARMFYVDN